MKELIKKEPKKIEVKRFVKIVYEILENPDFKSIICWGLDGSTFQIK